MGAVKDRNDILVVGFVEKFFAPGMTYADIAATMPGDLTDMVKNVMQAEGLETYAGFKAHELADQMHKYAESHQANPRPPVNPSSLPVAVPADDSPLTEKQAALSRLEESAPKIAALFDADGNALPAVKPDESPQEKPVKVTLALMSEHSDEHFDRARFRLVRITTDTTHAFKNYAHRAVNPFLNLEGEGLTVEVNAPSGQLTLRGVIAAIVEESLFACEVAVEGALAREKREEKVTRDEKELRDATERREMDQRHWVESPQPGADFG